jgi:hypothetical protein
MCRILIFITVCVVAISAQAADLPSSPAERFLHEGSFAEGETALLLALDADSKDDEARFGLGVIQFVRAVQNLGQSLYEYGAMSNNNQMFLRLPVPINESPSAINYKELGRVLDAFASDLGRAEATLAAVQDDQVKLRLRLSGVTFDFTGTGKERTTLLQVLVGLNGGRLEIEKANPDFRVHLDRGDVAWLRAYCHLLCATSDAYRAVDGSTGFDQRVSRVFPKVESSGDKNKDIDWQGLKLVDAPRLRRMRLHFVKVCELNHETWAHYRKETDDDYEWIPNAKQTDQLGLPLTDERIDAWLGMMTQLEGLMTGERLVPSNLLLAIHVAHPLGQGLNLRKLLDNPRADLLNWERINVDGIDAKYLEPEEGKPVLDLNVIFNVLRLFSGPFGFAEAARLN